MRAGRRSGPPHDERQAPRPFHFPHVSGILQTVLSGKKSSRVLSVALVALVACSDDTGSSTNDPAGGGGAGGDLGGGGGAGGGGAGGEAPCDLSEACLQEELDRLCYLLNPLGAVLAVQVDPETRYVAACGFADIAKTRPMVVNDRFRVGSITKTFTSALVLRRVEAGTIALSDTVDSFGLTSDASASITVAHLLSNTSGLIDYNFEPTFDWDSVWTTPEVLTWVTDNFEPAFAPGESFLYSGTGFLLASEVVATTGTPYTEALRQELLVPLGLQDTFLEGAEPIPGGLVEGSLLSGSGPIPPEHDVLWPSADGTLVSTADDVLTFFQHLLMSRDVLSAATLETMLEPTMLTGGATPDYPSFLGDSSYGLGIATQQDADGPIHWHGGVNFGFVCQVSFQPATGRGVAVMINTEDVSRLPFVNLGWDLLRR